MKIHDSWILVTTLNIRHTGWLLFNHITAVRWWGAEIISNTNYTCITCHSSSLISIWICSTLTTLSRTSWVGVCIWSWSPMIVSDDGQFDVVAKNFRSFSTQPWPIHTVRQKHNEIFLITVLVLLVLVVVLLVMVVQNVKLWLTEQDRWDRRHTHCLLTQSTLCQSSCTPSTSTWSSSPAWSTLNRIFFKSLKIAKIIIESFIWGFSQQLLQLHFMMMDWSNSFGQIFSHIINLFPNTTSFSYLIDCMICDWEISDTFPPLVLLYTMIIIRTNTSSSSSLLQQDWGHTNSFTYQDMKHLDCSAQGWDNMMRDWGMRAAAVKYF